MSKGANLNKLLREGKPIFGTFCSLPAFHTVELIASSGFDYVLLDAEHGATNPMVVHSQLAALSGSNTAAMVRLPSHDASVIKQYLDLGVDGLMVPSVDTAEQAQAVVRLTQYPPHGIRGIAGSVRATNYTRDKAYAGDARNRFCLAVQIESPTAIKNLDAICNVDGVDVLFFGPNDLAAQSGLLGQPFHPDNVKVLEEGIRTVRKHGKVAGILIGEGDCDKYLKLGVQMIVVGSEVGLFVQAADGLASRLAAKRDVRVGA
jgi:4-hydroxy-2-oxoheptanedioate aldolase